MSTSVPARWEVEDRWPLDSIPETTLGQVVLASRLLGADRTIVNLGGGNTSAKGTSLDHLGEHVETIWVKGSGSDLAVVNPDDFTALRLADTLHTFSRDAMSDEEMVAHLARCQLDPAAPRSSIETLLHAFIPALHVHHTHPDAINMLACSANGRSLVEECFGDRAAWIEYVRPGFALAKQVGQVVRADPALELIVLAKHGLVVWGSSAEEAYRRTIAIVNQAVEFVSQAVGEAHRIAGVTPGIRVDRVAVLREVLPTLRGAVSSERPKLLVTDLSPRAVEFVSSSAAPDLVTVGAACPDHLVHTKRLPLWVPFDPVEETTEILRARINERARQYREEYLHYFRDNATGGTVSADPDARVVLIQHVGLVGVGNTVRAAAFARDLYQRSIEVMAGAYGLGGFVSLTAAESFAVEYWPLELYKLSLQPASRELEGKVALVTGGAGGIGRAVINALACAGAVVVAFDRDAEGAAASVADLGETGLAVAGDVTRESDVRTAFAAAIEAFGGVDVVVSNAGIASSAPVEETTTEEWDRAQSILSTGYFLVARETFRVLRQQGMGGSIIFVASKNALVAGKNAAAYSVAKAAELHLARCLAEEGGSAGIRVNTVNPDAVLQGSRIWDSSWRRDRAAAYGVPEDQLEEFYRRRTTLGVSVLPTDVAEAVLHFASDRRSGKSTGNILNVDGGVAAAFPR